jgi:hypothetical protein
MARPLGKNQLGCLRALGRHGYWASGWGSGWTWHSDSETRRILDSLVRRGLVRHECGDGINSQATYSITIKGEQLLATERRRT